jgi:hypothetical protein
MAIPAQLLTLIVRNNEEYLGMVRFPMVRQQLTDIFVFPVPNSKRIVSLCGGCKAALRGRDGSQGNQFSGWRLSEKIKAFDLM